MTNLRLEVDDFFSNPEVHPFLAFVTYLYRNGHFSTGVFAGFFGFERQISVTLVASKDELRNEFIDTMLGFCHVEHSFVKKRSQ